jgi:50S ribosomal protein L16 3-hydroxylase
MEPRLSHTRRPVPALAVCAEWHNSPMHSHPESTSLLGSMSAAHFLRDYWQKKPLVVRGAWTADWMTPAELFALAARPDAEARLVSASRGQWKVTFGPQLAMPTQKRDWTVLVQGANLASREADRLLLGVNFLPRWRLDDVMISYAAPGGGVGPHVDSYDVFLLQVSGNRRWRYGRQRDLALKPGLPLKILENFVHDEECTLGPGDMLYLPPNMAHEGVALESCMTASIGFRAPTFTEATREFLHHAADTIQRKGRYADKGRKPAAHPGEIDDHLIDAIQQQIEAVQFGRDSIVEFLGSYLSEPKPTVFFDERETGSSARLADRARRRGVALDARSNLLFSRDRFFFNGETLRATGRERRLLSALADQRHLSGDDMRDATPLFMHQVCEWLADGWLQLGD